MNPQTKMPTTADEFLRWNEGREGKREFVRGRVVEMMINVTRNHARVATNIILALGKRLDLTFFDIGSADFGVRTPEGVRYPDVYVDRRGPDTRGSDLATIEPVFLAEILSESSLARDFVEKLADYAGLPSLFHYAILSQKEPRVWLWTRSADAWTGPLEVVGANEPLRLTGLHVEVHLAELYAGIDR